MKNLIAFVGMKHVGKTTLATHLETKHNYQPLAFADPLKDSLSILFHKDRNVFDDPIRKESVMSDLNVTPRRLMQEFGTGICREALPRLLPELKLRHDCLWLHLMDIELEKETKSNIIITDARHENEIEYIRKKGGHLVYIDRFDQDISILDQHESEQAHVFKGICDFVITNHGKKELMIEQIDAFIASL